MTIVHDYVGCTFAVTPTRQSTFLVSLVNKITESQHSAITNVMGTNNFIEYVVSFGFNETNQPVNSSFCDISSLEVYRGREQAIEISHQGFFINDSGSIEVR